MLPRWTAVALWILPFAYAASLVVSVASSPRPTIEPPSDTATVGEVFPRAPLPLVERKAIFAELVKHRREWWKKARHLFPEHRWSRHDNFHDRLARKVRDVAAERGLHIATVYLVYDEGVRHGWKTAFHGPFEATWVPLDPRTR